MIVHQILKLIVMFCLHFHITQSIECTQTAFLHLVKSLLLWRGCVWRLVTIVRAIKVKMCHLLVASIVIRVKVIGNACKKRDDSEE